MSMLGIVWAFAALADGDATRGEQLYRDFACYSCHGHSANGRVPLSADQSGVLSRADVFITYLRLRADENPVNPRSTMPHYSVNTLSDAQALDIYAYIASLKQETPEFDEIPIMRKLVEDAERRANLENR